LRSLVTVILALCVAACVAAPGTPIQNRVPAVASTPPAALVHVAPAAGPHSGTSSNTIFSRAPLLATSIVPDDLPEDLPLAAPLEAPRESSLGLAVTTTSFQLRGADRPLLTEIFRPDGPGPHPGLLILHGASGVGDGEAAYLRAAAEYFATQGMLVYMPHYLDHPRQRGRAAPRGGSTNTIAQYDLLAARIDAVVDDLSRSPLVDRDRIVVFGFSLGAFHGLALASRDQRVRGIASLGGGIPGNVAPTVRRMPPTFVIHGGRDAIVPVARARQAHKLAQDRGADAQIVVYAEQGHFLRGAAGPDALARATRFLRCSVNLPPTLTALPAQGVRMVRVAPSVDIPPPPPPRPGVRR
jgi:dienelactone hydrolase